MSLLQLSFKSNYDEEQLKHDVVRQILSLNLVYTAKIKFKALIITVHFFFA